MTNFVPNYEDRYYEVHPSQLRWAMHQLDSVPNYNVRCYTPGRGGMYIVVVQVPIGAADADWRAPQPQRRRWLRFDWRVAVKWLCVLVIVGGLGYLAYGVLTGATQQDAQQASQPSQAASSLWDQIAAKLPQMPAIQPPAPRGEPVVEGTGWHWPWESSVVSQPQVKDDGFRWPWQDAQDAAGEAVESIKVAGLVIVLLVVVVCVLWVVGVARRAIGK